MGRAFLTSFAALALALAGAPSAVAQGQPQQPPPRAQGASYDSEELKSYAVARMEVRKINQEYSPQFQGAGTQQEKKAIQKEATDKMVDAIRAEGISVKKYNEISRAAGADPNLAERIRGHMEDAQ